MKDKLKYLYEIKALTSMFFVGEVAIYSIINYINGIDYIKISVLLQLALLALIIVFLQYMLYTYDKALKISIYVRTIIHYISLLSVFIVSSNVFNLFDLSNKKNISIFSLGFTIMYILAFTSMATYYKITGEKFNEKLNKYKNKKAK